MGGGRDGLNGYKANLSPAKLKLADIGLELKRDGLNGYKANLSPAKLKLADNGAGVELGNMASN